MAREPGFYNTLLTQIGMGMALEFCCLRCQRRKMIGLHQLPDSIRDRADKIRVRDLEYLSHCVPCRRLHRKSVGVRVEVVPGRS